MIFDEHLVVQRTVTEAIDAGDHYCVFLFIYSLFVGNESKLMEGGFLEKGSRIQETGLSKVVFTWLCNVCQRRREYHDLFLCPTKEWISAEGKQWTSY